MKPRFLPDTSCIVAAVSSWHSDHEATVEEIQRRLSKGEEMVTAAPSLVEAYAVLTRLPASHRLMPADALRVIEASFMTDRRIVALASFDYVRLLRTAPSVEVSGGRTYDAVIAQCALKARARFLLTLNEDHFRHWESESLTIVVPSPKSTP